MQSEEIDSGKQVVERIDRLCAAERKLLHDVEEQHIQPECFRQEPYLLADVTVANDTDRFLPDLNSSGNALLPSTAMHLRTLVR